MQDVQARLTVYKAHTAAGGATASKHDLESLLTQSELWRVISSVSAPPPSLQLAATGASACRPACSCRAGLPLQLCHAPLGCVRSRSGLQHCLSPGPAALPQGQAALHGPCRAQSPARAQTAMGVRVTGATDSLQALVTMLVTLMGQAARGPPLPQGVDVCHLAADLLTAMLDVLGAGPTLRTCSLAVSAGQRA